MGLAIPSTWAAGGCEVASPYWCLRSSVSLRAALFCADLAPRALFLIMAVCGRYQKSADGTHMIAEETREAARLEVIGEVV